MPFEFFRFMPRFSPINSLSRVIDSITSIPHQIANMGNGLNPPRLNARQAAELGLAVPGAVFGCGARTGLRVPPTCSDRYTPAPSRLGVFTYNLDLDGRSVTFGFTDNSSNESRFIVERALVPFSRDRTTNCNVDNYEAIQEIPAQANFHSIVRFTSVIPDIPLDQIYCFRVRAVFEDCVSGASNSQSPGLWGLDPDAGLVPVPDPDASVSDVPRSDASIPTDAPSDGPICARPDPTYSLGSFCPSLREEIIQADPLRSLRTSPTGPLDHPSAVDTARVEAQLEREFPGLIASFPLMALGEHGEFSARISGVISYLRTPNSSGNETLWILASRRNNDPAFYLLTYEVRANQVLRPLETSSGLGSPVVNSVIYGRSDFTSNVFSVLTPRCNSRVEDVLFPSAMAYLNGKIYILNGGNPTWPQRNDLILALNPSLIATELARAADSPLSECRP